MTRNGRPAESITGEGGKSGTPEHPVDPSAPTAAEQAERVLTPEQTRQLTIDIMASWALDGLHPTPEIIENINGFLSSGLTAGEYVEKLKRSWGAPEPDSEP